MLGWNYHIDIPYRHLSQVIFAIADLGYIYHGLSLSFGHKTNTPTVVIDSYAASRGNQTNTDTSGGDIMSLVIRCARIARPNCLLLLDNTWSIYCLINSR